TSNTPKKHASNNGPNIVTTPYIRRRSAQAATNWSLGSWSYAKALPTGYILIEKAQKATLRANINHIDWLEKLATQVAATAPNVSSVTNTGMRPMRSDSHPAGHCSTIAHATLTPI